MAESVRRRREELLDLLRTQELVSNRQLGDSLDISQSTLRRDLDALEEKGLVERIHGSARLAQRPDRAMDKRELWFYNRREIAVAEKKAIARAALDFLEPDDVIMIDASTSGLFFARAIPADLSLTIITHSAYLPVELADKSNIQLICTGGILHSRSMCYVGLEAENNLQHLHAHRAFFGVKGLTLREGCTDVSPLEVRLKASMAREAHELVLLADHSKLGNVALASFAPANRVSTLVTDELADPDLIQALKALDVQVIQAPLSTNST
jgi:DeoR/GlpR family transcriptional regulator of sugar metabolism